MALRYKCQKAAAEHRNCGILYDVSICSAIMHAAEWAYSLACICHFISRSLAREFDMVQEVQHYLCSSYSFQKLEARHC